MLFGLDGLCPGERATVIYMGTQKTLAARLKDFGFVPGTSVYCCYRGPGCKVTALRCRGSTIALRTCDLKNILVRTDG